MFYYFIILLVVGASVFSAGRDMPGTEALQKIVGMTFLTEVTEQDAKAAQPVVILNGRDVEEAKTILKTAGLKYNDDFITNGQAGERIKNGNLLTGFHYISNKKLEQPFGRMRMRAGAKSKGWIVTTLLPTDYVIDKALFEQAIKGLMVFGGIEDFPATASAKQIQTALQTKRIGRGIVIVQNTQVAIGQYVKFGLACNRVIFYHKGRARSALFLTKKESTSPPQNQKPMGMPAKHMGMPAESMGMPAKSMGMANDMKKSTMMTMPAQERLDLMGILGREIVANVSATDAKESYGAAVAVNSGLTKMDAQSVLKALGIKPVTKFIDVDEATKNLNAGRFLGGMHWIDKTALTTPLRGVLKVMTGKAQGYTVTTIVPTDPEISNIDFNILARTFSIASDAAKSDELPVSMKFSAGMDLVVQRKMQESEGLILVRPMEQIPIGGFIGAGYTVKRFIYFVKNVPHSVVVVIRKGSY